MFKKILIANRGEIACRVMRTAKKMGIATVAVYSDADAKAPHVRMADEAVHIGPAAAAESYLVADKIIEACKQTGAEAVHPGYGFLSERASFVKALDEAGIAFIGPPAGAIAAMGDKIESKKLAREAGVNVVPGYLGEIADTEEAVKIAADIGYPVMMKASAGGGGKGMRLAWSEKDVREGFEATKREGLNSFGDDRVFLEKFIEEPRHIEIQVLGDKHGNTVYLGERECSIQRRHQKVIEEAPSPFVTPEMRKAMGEQAVALAKAVDYHSAGTVELIVSGKDKTGESFYFLEMNTRLQVEHPVTEEITGVDLVEQMIRVAAGEKLPFVQGDIAYNGWAIEARVYAEDPYRGFLPSTGRLTTYSPPHEERSEEGVVRVDDGVAEGGEVSMFYDPMIAKLITHGETRDEAIELAVEALDAFELDGLADNIDFLSALLQHERFKSGELTTGFIAEEYPEGFEGAPTDAQLKTDLVALAAIVGMTHETRMSLIDGQLGEPVFPSMEQAVILDGERHEVTVDPQDGETLVTVGEEEIEVIADYSPGQSLLVAGCDDRRRIVQVAQDGRGFTLVTRGARHSARVLPRHVADLIKHMPEKVAPDLSRFLMAPMPGLLTKLHVAEGDAVEAGQPLAVVEAMKMENILRAEKAGTVKAVPVAEGASLQVDEVIVEFE
ncbi:acetyl-CoA carboxylase biotin carboxylase subunit [Sphingomicrobium aestuariivivum]|uniref:acetyl-CoA carboxylase biotin carboxylase subunit n=1 Tax=Sphingomicrobium aestuariivivum TaxID=1582356 RepID=UPI001FD67D96|nr:acetyl/propionyl/methylcrotonyl-CoA carboxylase subunit alpha [Sphingomicrobium aestuariivivum]MCJ8191490.1 acetyl/propionyl/methylcrotonyl-CoA carboxylase subunit alpha [Sphingomicrobium aestuariivivum]